MAFEDDIHFGSFSEIGEALRGMQGGRPYVGAGPQHVAALHNALGQLAAQNRFGRHMPMQKTMRSPYKDSTQLGVQCTGSFAPSAWSGSTLPQVTGLSRVYKSFKPEKAILSEILTFTWVNSTQGTTTTVAAVNNAVDTVLVTAFAGADNCFPNAPTASTGITGVALASNALGNGISWPTINGGIDLTVGFAIEASAQFQSAPPSGYTQAQLTSIAVNIRLALWGESLR